MTPTPPLNEKIGRLTEFLPYFEAPGATLGEVVSPSPSSTTKYFPFFKFNKVGVAFCEACYELGWVKLDFNWGRWKSTEEALKLRDDPEHLAQADADQISKVLTCLLRQERFCEGSLENALQSGWLLRIIQRLDAIKSESLDIALLRTR